MIAKDALKFATIKLQKTKIASAHLDAEVLLSFVLEKPKEFIFTYPEKKLSAGQIKELKKLIARRAKNEPIAYLTGHKEFYGLDFLVNKNVLIPRPETELIVEEVLSLFQVTSSKLRVIVDVGTGSGCIAIAIKKNLPQAEVLAIDQSAKALEVAKKNARLNKTKIKFFKGDLLLPIKNKKIDLIVANLPYLSDETLKKLGPEIKFEPKTALSAGQKIKNETDDYEELFFQVKKFGFNCPIILETHPPINNLIKKIAKKFWPQAKITVKQDLGGRSRVMVIEEIRNI